MTQTPSLLVYGANLWCHGPTTLSTQRKIPRRAKNLNYTRLMSYIWPLNDFTKTILRQGRNTPYVFVLQDLVYPGFGRNSVLEHYNNVAVEYLGKNFPEIIVWDTGRTLSDYLFYESHIPVIADGRHLTIKSYELQVQFLLNYLLNANCAR